MLSPSIRQNSAVVGGDWSLLRRIATWRCPRGHQRPDPSKGVGEIPPETTVGRLLQEIQGAGGWFHLAAAGAPRAAYRINYRAAGGLSQRV